MDGTDTVVRACLRHAHWLRDCSAEDGQVRIVDTANIDELNDVCGWCGFTPTGTPQQRDGIAFCHGPGVPEPTCWQQAASEGHVIAADFSRYRDDGGVD